VFSEGSYIHSWASVAQRDMRQVPNNIFVLQGNTDQACRKQILRTTGTSRSKITLHSELQQACLRKNNWNKKIVVHQNACQDEIATSEDSTNSAHNWCDDASVNYSFQYELSGWSSYCGCTPLATSLWQGTNWTSIESLLLVYRPVRLTSADYAINRIIIIYRCGAIR